VAVILTDLLTQAALVSSPSDETDLAKVRAQLFACLRASGWAPSGKARGALGAAASDAALLAAFVEGEASAFDALFERHAPRLNGWARRWLRGGNAEDAVQEAFVVLFEKAPSIVAHEHPNVAAFLFTTLRYGVLRALSRREVPEAEPGVDEPSSEDDGLTALLRREDAGRLAHLLERVCNPLEQQVVMLDLEDRSDAEIASAIGIAPGHVRVVRHRAHEKLRRGYGENLGASSCFGPDAPDARTSDTC
jgi:RNA polymerase sigma factor (sigma-70 family)